MPPIKTNKIQNANNTAQKHSCPIYNSINSKNQKIPNIFTQKNLYLKQTNSNEKPKKTLYPVNNILSSNIKILPAIKTHQTKNPLYNKSQKQSYQENNVSHSKIQKIPNIITSNKKQKIPDAKHKINLYPDNNLLLKYKKIPKIITSYQPNLTQNNNEKIPEDLFQDNFPNRNQIKLSNHLNNFIISIIDNHLFKPN